MPNSEAPDDVGTTVPSSRAELGTRLSLVVDKIGGNKPASELAGVTAEQIRVWKGGGAKVPFESAAKLAAGAGVSLDWLAYGRVVVAPGNHDIDQEFVYVPRYDVEASAGSGALVDGEAVLDVMAFRRDWVRHTLGVDPSQLALITEIGDSMETTIHAGDLMLVHRGVNHIQDDAIYVLRKRGELVVKRVQALFNGNILIKSDNPAYQVETLTNDEAQGIEVAGRVLWAARML